MGLCPVRGVSLVELLVALVLLEIAGLAALSAALTADRLGRRAGLGRQTDRERWTAIREAELDSTCVWAAHPELRPIQLPGNMARPARTIRIRCGP